MEEPALILNSGAREGFDSEGPAEDTTPAKAQSCGKCGRASRAQFNQNRKLNWERSQGNLNDRAIRNRNLNQY